MIADELSAQVPPTLLERRITDVRIGLGYTGVMLEDGNVGVAYTFREAASGGCSVFTGSRPLASRSAGEILPYLRSRDTVESSVGLAVLNALVNRIGPGQTTGDVLDVLPLGPEDKVGMVGYFGPLVEPLRKRVQELTIFERDVARSDHLRPAEEAHGLLPSLDVALITSTALILGRLDGLLEAAAACREVVLVGASTPLLPKVFAEHGVTLLSGITVTDGPAILQIASEGGGMGFFGPRVRKVNIGPLVRPPGPG